MLYSEIIAVCSEIHTKKHTNTLCGKNVELLHVKLAVHIVTLERLDTVHPTYSISIYDPAHINQLRFR